MLDAVTTDGTPAGPPPNSPLCDAVMEESSVGETDGIDIRRGDDGNEEDASPMVTGIGFMGK